MRAFWLELKSICKSFKFLAVIIVVLAFQVMLFAQFQRENQESQVTEMISNNYYRSEMYGWTGFWERRIANPVRFSLPLETIEYNLSWYAYELNIAETISQAYASNDWEAYNRAQAERDLLHWTIHRSRLISRGQLNPQRPTIPTHEGYFGTEWERLKTLVDYRPDLEFAPFMAQEREFALPEELIFSAAYHLSLLREGLAPKGPQDTSAWGFAFNFLRRGLPTILGIIVLLTTINLVHQDKKSGTIKSVLQMPRGRIYYLLRKTALGFTASALALLIPMALVFIALGLQNGFAGLNFPVLVDTTIMDWKMPPDPVLYRFKDFSPTYQVGLSQYQLSVIENYVTIGRLYFIPLWRFMGMAALLVGLFILLYSVLGVLLSVLIRNELAAQGAAIAVFALGAGFGSFFFPRLGTTPWDVFAKVNVIPILEGSHYTTYLASVVIVAGVAILLFGLSFLAFRKQDITGEQS